MTTNKRKKKEKPDSKEKKLFRKSARETGQNSDKFICEGEIIQNICTWDRIKLR